MKPRFLNDTNLAEAIGMSRSWVRVQRYKRRHNLPHILNIDEVMIGSSPRYHVEDVETFIQSLAPANQNGETNNG
tara:strand:- start:433 stop:657 length:225 start_codon:yes stop_codon:yes gene_type:complete